MDNSGPRVFISYAHHDRHAVESILRALEKHQVKFWDAQQIAAGANWMESIESAIEQASVFVLCVSPDFFTSQFAMFEVGLAIGRARKTGAAVIPIILRDSKIPKSIMEFSFLDARAMRPQEIAEKIGQIVATKSPNDTQG